MKLIRQLVYRAHKVRRTGCRAPDTRAEAVPAILNMMTSRIAASLLFAAAACGQTVCPPTPKYSPCDLVFDLPGTSPESGLDLHAEIRSPHHDTVRANAFWDGGTKWVIRFTPDEAGEHTFRLTGPGPLNGKEGQLTATANAKPG